MKALDAASLRRAFAGAAAALEVQRDALNAINVFPVPDGDTGTNMSLTMRAAATTAAAAEEGGAHDVARAAADGALMGARGNSGVILSQILAGLAHDEEAVFDGGGLSTALRRAKESAYGVVSQPREGTILTAIAEAAAAARLCALEGESAVEVLEAAAAAAQVAADASPDLLPVLKEAGVVDAGAQGLAVMLDGMLRGVLGEQAGAATDLGAIDASWLSATRRVHEDGEAAGFCTEFVVRGEGLDLDEMRGRLSQLGESLLVVGGSSVVRIHVHTRVPDEAIAFGRELGVVSNEKVEDMEAQFRELATTPTATRGLAVVVVAAGDGLAALFRSLGAAAVVHGGQTMNPSAGEIRDAIAAAGGRETIVLPNNKNIVLAAEQAASATGGRTTVIPTQNIPQGVAALVAMNPEGSMDENVAAMRAATEAVHSGEVTLAARGTRVNGLSVREGQPIGLVDGELVVAEETVADAVLACVGRLVAGREDALVTLYVGADETAEAAEAIAATARERFSCEVEVVEGGQPHYACLIGVE